MSSVMQAFEGIEIMLRGEIKSLEDSCTSLPGDNQLAGSLQRKVKTVSNLSKTMGGLMRNIIHEVHKSRDDMLQLMEQLDGSAQRKLPGMINPPAINGRQRKFSEGMEFGDDNDDLGDDDAEERKSLSSGEVASEISGADSDYIEYNVEEENEIF